MSADQPDPPENFPAWKHEFVQDALDADSVVTEIDDTRYGHKYHAALDVDGTVWLATIETDNGDGLDGGPRVPDVRFRRCYPGEDLHVLHSWSTVAIKGLSGPSDLKSWRSIFRCFEAALEMYDDVEGSA